MISRKSREPLPIVGAAGLRGKLDAHYSGPFLPSPRMAVSSVFVHGASRGGRVVCAYTGAYRTLNRWSLVIVGVTPQPGGYPSVKGFVCPRAHHHQRSPRPSSSGKAALFLSSRSPTVGPAVPPVRSGPETIIPRPATPESHARFSWLALRRLFATGTMPSLIKISFRDFPHPLRRGSPAALSVSLECHPAGGSTDFSGRLSMAKTAYSGVFSFLSDGGIFAVVPRSTETAKW